MKLSNILLLSASLLPFHVHAMENPYEIVEYVFDHNVTYSPGVIKHHQEGDTFSVPPCLPQKVRNQKALIYSNLKEFKESALYKESSLYKVVQGQDARKQVLNTTTWPHCINTKLQMTLNTNPWPWGGSGAMVGPHHVFTCGHCVYDTEKKVWFDKILAYPALNGDLAPFGELQVTKAYIFRGCLNGDSDFDMALLLVDQSIGEYTGWGGFLSASDIELAQQEINITGYPGDKGFKRNSPGHRI